jgi:hypothetical protein
MVARIMIKAPEHRRALWQIVLLMLPDAVLGAGAAGRELD